jgi:hypothetical protein
LRELIYRNQETNNSKSNCLFCNHFNNVKNIFFYILIQNEKQNIILHYRNDCKIDNTQKVKQPFAEGYLTYGYLTYGCLTYSHNGWLTTVDIVSISI